MKNIFFPTFQRKHQSTDMFYLCLCDVVPAGKHHAD